MARASRWGISSLLNALRAELNGHNNLGLHTEMFANSCSGLIEKGTIDGACKTIYKGGVVASFLLGSLTV